MHLLDVAARERDQVKGGQAEPCGYSCDCHRPVDATGPVVCVRAQHPHTHGDTHPHLGVAQTADGTRYPVQWECVPTPPPAPGAGLYAELHPDPGGAAPWSP